MPTGYTDPVQSGKITEFPEFAFNCARAFGALVMLRDDHNAPIPDKFEPSNYHAKALQEAHAALARLSAMSREQADAAAADEFAAAMANHATNVQRCRDDRKRYQAMLDKVLAWQPPTEHHAGLKTFMIEQLTESIKFDCNEYEAPQQQPGREWLQSRLEMAHRDIAYHSKEHTAEVQRAAERTEWIKQLRASLA
jgi:hypothetical protein